MVNPMDANEAQEWLDAEEFDDDGWFRALETIVKQHEQIKRLQAAIHKADKWGDILDDLYEDEFITEEDMQ